MLGVPLTTPTMLLGDNMSVILNTTVPSSQLKKKHNAIAYHHIREAIAGKIVSFVHIPSKLNVSDVMTKPIPNDQFLTLIYPHLFRKPIFEPSVTDNETSQDELPTETDPVTATQVLDPFPAEDTTEGTTLHLVIQNTGEESGSEVPEGTGIS